jgi:hypothetical protein
MRPAPDKAELAKYHDQLAKAFARRRCTCGAKVVSVAPGTPDRNYCVTCLGRLIAAPVLVDKPVGGGDGAGA